MGEISTDTRRRVELRLRWYPVLLRKIDNVKAKIRKRQAELEEKWGYSLPSAWMSKIASGETNVIFQREQDHVIRKMEPDSELVQLFTQLRKLEAERDAIRAGIKSLLEVQREFMRLRYFYGKQFKEIMHELNMSRRSAYRLRDDTIERLLQSGL